jgi:hypothetical protein
MQLSCGRSTKFFVSGPAHDQALPFVPARLCLHACTLELLNGIRITFSSRLLAKNISITITPSNDLALPFVHHRAIIVITIAIQRSGFAVRSSSLPQVPSNDQALPFVQPTLPLTSLIAMIVTVIIHRHRRCHHTSPSSSSSSSSPSQSLVIFVSIHHSHFLHRH